MLPVLPVDPSPEPWAPWHGHLYITSVPGLVGSEPKAFKELKAFKSLYGAIHTSQATSLSCCSILQG